MIPFMLPVICDVAMQKKSSVFITKYTGHSQDASRDLAPCEVREQNVLMKEADWTLLIGSFIY